MYNSRRKSYGVIGVPPRESRDPPRKNQAAFMVFAAWLHDAASVYDADWGEFRARQFGEWLGGIVCAYQHEKFPLVPPLVSLGGSKVRPWSF